jgi:hypothetical protein
LIKKAADDAPVTKPAKKETAKKEPARKEKAES